MVTLFQLIFVARSLDMSCWQKSKLVGPLVLFNILLPTWDVYSDFKLSMKLMMGGSQNCSIEEENVQEFRQELDLCLQNPLDYCQNQSDSIASYLCHYQSTSTCMFCQYANTPDYVQCDTPAEGIREIYKRCLRNNRLSEIDPPPKLNSYIYQIEQNGFNKNGSRYDYCTDPETYHGICEEVTRHHYIFAIMLLGIYEEFIYLNP